MIFLRTTLCATAFTLMCGCLEPANTQDSGFTEAASVGMDAGADGIDSGVEVPEYDAGPTEQLCDAAVASDGGVDIDACRACPDCYYSSGLFPEGSIAVNLVETQPEAALEPGISFEVTYRIELFIGSPQDTETFAIEVLNSDSSWSFEAPPSTLELSSDLGTTTNLTLTVTPPEAGSLSAALALRVYAIRGPNYVHVEHSTTFTVGEVPPQDEFLQVDRSSDGLEFALANQYNFGPVVFNNTDEEQRFRLSHIASGGWLPTNAEDSTTFVTVSARHARTLTNTIIPAVDGLVGSSLLLMRATLVEQSGAPVEDGKSVELQIPFTVQ